MATIEYKASTTQYTMACLAAARLKARNKKQVRFTMVMPPGSGKSRVIMALIHLVKKTFSQIRVLYTHKSLLEQDKQHLERTKKFTLDT